MSLNELGETADGGFAHVGPMPRIHVPLKEVAENPLLRRARIVDGALTWPGLNHDQLEAVNEITLYQDRGWVSIPPRVNLDVFVDRETDEGAPPFWTGRATDIQRYYTRFTDTQFLHIGTFTAITIDTVRRYFMWSSDAWLQISLGAFIRYRDDGDTHFSETKRDDIAGLSPGALEAKPTRAESGNSLAELLEQIVGGTIDDDEELEMTEVDAMIQHGRAAAIASIAHRNQVDKIGYDYIDHPARVAEAFDWLEQPRHHCAAWLHDVIEDSDITADDLLAAGVLPEIVEVVELLTRRADVSGEDYYERIRQHPVARAVKLADIADNLAEWRFTKLDYETQVRLSNKYFAARAALEAGDTE